MHRIASPILLIYLQISAQHDSIPNYEELATSESTIEVVHGQYVSPAAQYVHLMRLAEQASGNQGTDTIQAKLFSEVEESDSNFVSMLEREAGMVLLTLAPAPAHMNNNIDAEFDRTFSAEQNEQEGSIEATIRHDSTWDEWDDEDAEGEDEEDWIDPDAASNESSVTLSSKASSKRGYDEVDPSEAAYVEDPHASPGTSCVFSLYSMSNVLAGSKRPRVQ